MVGLAMFVMLIFLVITMSLAQTQEDGSDQVSWANRNDNGKETVTNLQFYFHDTVGGKNPSAVPVAKANQTNTSPTGFGLLMMADDPLTVAPDPNSKLVGRARGLYGSAGQTELGLIMVMNFGFTGGIYNGSSFTIATLNPALNPVRELSIVGGTGLFRLARGYVIARTYSLDPTTGNAIVGYNATLVTFI